MNLTLPRSAKLLLTLTALLTVIVVSLYGPADARAERGCAKDRREGIIQNTGGPKCLKVLKVYNRAVIRDGYFRPYGSHCAFNPRRRHWNCEAGKYRTMNIARFEFSGGFVYRGSKRFIARVTYPRING